MNYQYIGKSTPVNNSRAKASGLLRYAGDMQLPNMLHMKLVLSPVAHGIVKAIDSSAALATPGVAAVLSFENTPDTKYNRGRVRAREDAVDQETLFSRHVRFVGDRVAAVLAVAIAAGLYPLLRRTERNPRILDRLLLGALVLTLCYWAYVTFARFPADVDPDHLYEGTKNAYTLLGCLIGLLIAHAFDEKKLHFSVEAVWWAQLLKVGLGLLLILGVRVGLKPVLNAVLPVYPAAAVRYCLMVVFAGCVWPLTFPWFARLGRAE